MCMYIILFVNNTTFRTTIMSHWVSCLRSADKELTGRIAGDMAKAGLATAMMLSPLAAITLGENLLASSAASVCSSNVLCNPKIQEILLDGIPCS